MVTTHNITIKNHQTANVFVDSMLTPDSLGIEEVISRIIKLNEGLRAFWSKAAGWAPIEAAEILTKSRLDWQVSLSHCLLLWIDEGSENTESGKLILAWTNLGSLVEGTMKLFLSVWYNDYKQDIDAFRRKNKIQNPDGLTLEPLKQYFCKKIWGKTWSTWADHIQQRRNTIHAFKPNDIGSREELFNDIRKYLRLLRYINYRLPYPDDVYSPSEI